MNSATIEKDIELPDNFELAEESRLPKAIELPDNFELAEQQPKTEGDAIPKLIQLSDNFELVEEKQPDTIKSPAVLTVPELKDAGPSAEVSMWRKLTNKITTTLGLKETPEEAVAHAQNVYALAQAAGVTPTEAEHNLDRILTEQTGLKSRAQQTQEFMTGVTSAGLAAGAIAAPLSTAAAVGIYSVLDAAGKKAGILPLKKFLPEEASTTAEDIVDLAEMAGKIWVTAGIMKNAIPAFESATKQLITEYKMPEHLYYSADQLKAMTADEIGLFRSDMGLTAQQLRSARMNGVDIEIPAQKLSYITDRPYWSKIKETLGVKPFKTDVTPLAATPQARVIPKRVETSGEVTAPVTAPASQGEEVPGAPPFSPPAASPVSQVAAGQGAQGPTEEPMGDLWQSASDKAGFPLKQGKTVWIQGGKSGRPYLGTIADMVDENNVRVNISSITRSRANNQAGAQIVGISSLKELGGEAGRRVYQESLAAVPAAERGTVRQGAKTFDDLVRSNLSLYDAQSAANETAVMTDPRRIAMVEHKYLLAGREKAAEVLGEEGDLNNPVIRSRLVDKLKTWVEGPGRSHEETAITETEKRTVIGQAPRPINAGDLRSGDQVFHKGEWMIAEVDDANGEVTLRDGQTVKLDTFDKLDVAGGPQGIVRPGAEVPVADAALSSKSWRVEMPTEAETTEKINKTDILNWAEKTFGVPIRTKATHRWQHAGVYYPQQVIIRMAKWGELEPLTHEIAHDVDHKLRRLLTKHWKIKDIGVGSRRLAIKELADLDYDQKQRRMEEGFAEYMRYFLTTEDANQKAPVFDRFFKGTFLKENPDLANKLNQFKEKLTTWQKQGAENRILAQVDFKGEHTKLARPLTDKLQLAKDWILRNYNDCFYDIEKTEKEIAAMTGKQLPPSKSPFQLATYLKNTAGAFARTWVIEKQIDPMGNIIGPGLVEILEPIEPERERQFLAYAISRRGLLKSSQGKETGFDVSDMTYIVTKYANPQWDAAVDGITQWADNLMHTWIVKPGGLGEKEEAIVLELNPIYLPFKRAFIDRMRLVKGKIGFVDQAPAIKRFKGDTKPIINPIESLIAQATELIGKGQKIMIARAIRDIAQEQGVGGFISKVPAPLEAKTITGQQFKQMAEKLGVDIAGEVDLNSILTVFSQGFAYRGKENIYSFWVDGKREWYEINPQLARALTGIDAIQRSFVLKLCAPFARMVRLGATGLKVKFGLFYNPWRDALTYAVLSKKLTATPFDTFKGVARELKAKPGDPAWRFQATGGKFSGMIGFDRASTMATYDELLNSKLGRQGKVLQVVKHPIDTLRNLISATFEAGPRIAELETLLDKYRKENPSWSEADVWIAAMNGAKDVTINFTRAGFHAQKINEATAFFNVAIRGPEKFIRSLRENPSATVVKGMVWLTALGMFNWFRNKDRQWYKNLPLGYKYNNFWFEAGNTIIRLPIPFDVGIVFASAPIALLDTIYHRDAKYIEGLWDTIKSQIPDPTPSLFQGILDVGFNKDYLNQPIESEGLKNLPSAERKKYYTSSIASALSRGFNAVGIHLSPVQVDYLMNSYTGGLTKQLMFQGVREKADIPVLGEMVLRMPENPKRQLNEFWFDWEQLNQKNQAKLITGQERRQLTRMAGFYEQWTREYSKKLKLYNKNGNQEGLQRLYTQMANALKRYGYE